MRFTNNKTKYVYIPLALIALVVLIYLTSAECMKSICPVIFTSQKKYFSGMVNLLPKLVIVFVLFICFKILVSILKSVFFSRFIKKLDDEGKVENMFKLLRFSAWAMFFIISLSILVGNLGALLTSLGLIGFGLTFALQKPILNFVGWFTIIIKGIYREGDRIQVGEMRGDVIDIQLMNTVLEQLLETSDIKSKKILTFPNEFVLTSEVINYTKNENYIREELKISITYESDYHKAVHLLKSIIIDLIKMNKKKYIKKVKAKQMKIDGFLKDISKFSKKPVPRIKEEVERLEKDKQDLADELKHVEEMDDEFRPRIRVEMADSCIILIAQFLTPYREIKKNRTAINLAFMDAIKKEKNIEIAYPHMELVYHGKKK
ncbi:MAG: mechanosensitive ion channel family protein [Nanoarchaeota archaeon]|nr:mechanosensitive ion channel family protein [Nanoarchaeota archaeon]